MKRRIVQVGMTGHKFRNPVCHSRCPHVQICANHVTASDIRMEDGFTPNLMRERDGRWSCDQDETNTKGMLIWDFDKNKYAPLSPSYDV